MTLRLRHILVPSQHQAEDLQRLLGEGQDFGKLAQKFSTCPSASKGGDLGMISLKQLVQEFADAAEKLEVGQISGVVRTQFGYHLIQRQAE
jgi:peptidyl-prolyl cis-trans isomerase C